MAAKSGDDMLKMQEEAVRRVREMQSRARQHLESTEKAPVPPAPRPPQASAKKEETRSPEKSNAPLTSLGSSDIFEMLFKDHDRTLLLILLIMLNGENEDPSLMFALLYLLI